ncbi:MAG: hypothetical protein JWP40_4770 [Blastococcus sp.]|nr:hypothetical protein [Blastococcus sp.]
MVQPPPSGHEEPTAYPVERSRRESSPVSGAAGAMVARFRVISSVVDVEPLDDVICQAAVSPASSTVPSVMSALGARTCTGAAPVRRSTTQTEPSESSRASRSPQRW